jgi:hypothetical protein
MKQTQGILITALLVLTACAPAGRSFAPTLAVIVTPLPHATATRVIPPPASPGDTIVWENLQVTMDRPEITQDYITEFGSTRIPPAGQKFLWVHLQLRNRGQIELDVPASEHFSVLYAAAELKPAYGHRKDYADYTALGPVLFPDQELEGWLRFDIPVAAELNDLWFVFLPTSAEVGASPSSPNYPYAKDKPTYVWQCGS